MEALLVQSVVDRCGSRHSSRSRKNEFQSFRKFDGRVDRVLFEAVRMQKMIAPESTSDIDISRKPARESPVRASSKPTSHVPAKPPRAPLLLTTAVISPATFFGSISGTIAKNGPYGAYMAAPATIKNPYAHQKLSPAIR